MSNVPDRVTIGTLIGGRHPFVVPKYQRAYAWEDEEVGDFIADIQKMYSSRLPNPATATNHFLGGVFCAQQSAPGTLKGFQSEVIDGQQRLATVMLTLALIVQAFQEVKKEADRANDAATASQAETNAILTKQNYITYQDLSGSGGIQDLVRLRLSNADDTYFQRLVGGFVDTPGRDSHKRLRRAYTKLKNDLIGKIMRDVSLTPSDKLSRLLTLRSCIVQDCDIIFISSNSSDEAYKLFMVMNDRGRSLTDGDLLRSRTMELLDNHKAAQSNVENNWEAILAPSRGAVDRFLQAYYTAHTGERAPRTNVLDTFKKGFFNYGAASLPGTDVADAASVQTRVTGMKNEADTFAAVSDGQWPYSGSSVSNWDRDRLHRLIKILGHTLVIPLLLSARHNLTEKQFSDLVNVIERAAFRYFIVGAHPSGLSSIYYEAAKSINGNAANYSLSGIETSLKNLLTANADDTLLTVQLADKLRYSSSASKNRILGHFLTTLEDYYGWFQSGASGVATPNKTYVFDLGAITIEHIYPQTPDPSDVISALEPIKHELGNLTFLPPGANTSYSNKPFPVKKPHYAQSPVMITRDLGSLAVWDVTAQQHRQQQLIDMALKIFIV